MLEELGIHHEEYVIPPEVLATIEDKKKKAAAKNAITVAESKKRKNQVGPKAIAKKLKPAAAVAAPVLSSAGSSAHAASSAEVGSGDGTGGDHADSDATEEATALVSGRGGGLDAREPSVANLFPNVMGGNSGSESSKAADRGLQSLAKETEVPMSSSRRCATMTEVSEDETDLNNAERRAVSTSYVLQMSKELLLLLFPFCCAATL